MKLYMDNISGDTMEAACWFWVWLFVQASNPSKIDGFVLDGADSHCDACQCSNTQVYCNFKALSVIPSITPLVTTGHVTTYTIHFSGNKFTSVPGNTFLNFTSVNTTSVVLYLDNNQINTIHNNAFNGIENSVTFLSLESNNLTYVPQALGNLTVLDKLYLYGNPIMSLDAHVMSSVGRSLTQLWIGMGSFRSWPFEIGKLQQLQTLVLQKISSNQFMPADAFHGIGSSLKELQIYRSNLTKPPIAMCGLHNLTNFIYENNAKQDIQTPFFAQCMHNLTKLKYISLQHNHITMFPNVILLLPWAKDLNLNNNGISSIDTILIPADNNITYISLQHNKLSTIPNAMKNLKYLGEMHLSYNNITAVNKDDFSGLTQLYQLELNNNPIKYVAPGALRQAPNLSNLNMEYTNVTSIPEDVLYLPQLYFLPYMGNKVICDCSMSYLKSWNIQKVSFFTGFCNGDPLDQTLKHYILGDLKNCH